MKELTKSQHRVLDLMTRNKKENFGRLCDGRAEVIVVSRRARVAHAASLNAVNRLLKAGYIYAELFNYADGYAQFKLTPLGKAYAGAELGANAREFREGEAEAPNKTNEGKPMTNNSDAALRVLEAQ